MKNKGDIKFELVDATEAKESTKADSRYAKLIEQLRDEEILSGNRALAFNSDTKNASMTIRKLLAYHGIDAPKGKRFSFKRHRKIVGRSYITVVPERAKTRK